MFNHATTVWIDLIKQLLTRGHEHAPRGFKTREVIGNHAIIDMNYPIVYHPQRGLNYTFSAAEALFIANGDNRVENLAMYNKNIKKFSDDGLIFNGSYGPPFNNQLMYVVNTLKKDINTRQAVLTIWKQNPVKSADIRCTLSLQFIVRDGKMNTMVNMRSSDAWLGIPYDWFNFTIMTLRVLTLLNEYYPELDEYHPNPIQLGHLIWNAGSSHLYEVNFDQAYQVIKDNAYYNQTEQVPLPALTDWSYIVRSLVICRDKLEEQNHPTTFWQIRPVVKS